MDDLRAVNIGDPIYGFELNYNLIGHQEIQAILAHDLVTVEDGYRVFSNEGDLAGCELKSE